MIPGGPLHGLESASHGDAELQTDVMRFFALLAICLVALMSLAREPAPPAAEAPAPDPSPAAPAPAPAPGPTARPELLPAPPPPARASETASRPPPRKADAEPDAMPRGSPPSPPDAEKSDEAQAPLELRFASAQALERLEAAGQVGVFAIVEGSGYRWSTRLRRFRETALPETLYLMEPSTVPPGLVEALAASGQAAGAATWGVTLSPVIRGRLDRRLADSSGGLLLIDAAGRVRPAEGAE